MGTRSDPRDGGYGWVIVLTFFLMEVLVDGIRFSFGVYFVEFLNEFNKGKGETAWVGSLMIATYNIGGELICILINSGTFHALIYHSMLIIHLLNSSFNLNQIKYALNMKYIIQSIITTPVLLRTP